MLIARAPARISLAGGGTDFATYFERHGGLVISAAIARYAYSMVEVSGHPGLRISSSDYGAHFHHSPGSELTWDGELRLPRAVLHQYEVVNGIELFLASEIPPGSGLGGSGSVTVSLVKAFSTLMGDVLSPYDLAEEACGLEIGKLQMPIGKQDQYAAAFGGINAISFAAEGVDVQPLRLSTETRRRLEKSLMLFFTGSARDSALILAEQEQAIRRDQSTVMDALHRIKALAEETRRALERGEPDHLGELLHENWLNKRHLASRISTSFIEEMYQAARANGALGGKITGAGGGGFLMLYCPPARQEAVTHALAAHGLTRMEFLFAERGGEILLHTDPERDLRLVRELNTAQPTAAKRSGEGGGERGAQTGEVAATSAAEVD